MKRDGRYLLLDPYLSDSLTEKYAGTADAARADDATRRRPGAARLRRRRHLQPRPHRPSRSGDAQALRPRALVCPAGLRDLASERAGVVPHVDRRRRDRRGRPASASRLCAPTMTSPEGPSASSSNAAGGRSTTPATRPRTQVSVSGCARLRSTSPSCRSTVSSGTWTAAEAARVAKEAGARLAIPCHYDMFEFNTAAPDDFVVTCASLGQPYRVLRAGERLTISAQAPA